MHALKTRGIGPLDLVRTRQLTTEADEQLPFLLKPRRLELAAVKLAEWLL